MSQTSSLTPADRAASANFTMPKASVGQIVLWYQDGNVNGKPRPAVVTEVGPRSINLAPVRMLEERLGVRHHTDPLVKDFELAESGCWDHTEETKEVWQRLMSPNKQPSGQPKSAPPKDDKKE